MSLYVWYSNATDVTGKAIAESLISSGAGVSHGTEFTHNNPDLLVCYGCKPGRDFDYNSLRGISTLNHPRKIRENANKLASLEKMRNAGVMVADFWTADHVRSNGLQDIGQVIYIARKKFHQGGQGLTIVAQQSDVEFALEQGMDYFQKLIPKTMEYRVHVMGGDLLFAVRKVLQQNPYDNWRAERRELIQKRAGEQNLRLDEQTLDLALDICGKSMRLPDNIIRGLHRGWKFSNLSNPAAAIRDAAIGAVQAVELEFGAVDLMKGDDNRFYVLEVNSGPGLKGQNIERYRDAILARHEATVRRRREAERVNERAAREQRAARRDPGTTRATAETRGQGSGDLAGVLKAMMDDTESMSPEEKRELRKAFMKMAMKLEE